MRIKDTLEMIANAAIILTCGFFVALFVITYTRGARPQTGSAPAPRIPSYAIGDVLGPVADLDLAAAERSLILVFRSECRFCTDSVPFYKRVAAQIPSGSRTRQFVGITTDPIQTGRTYLASHGVALSQVVSVTASSLRVAGTPTLLLVDRSGKIQQIWRGRLPETQETAVLAALSDSKAGM